MSKVMLVEDDNNLREIYEARLQAEGYNIVTARDGEEALVVAKAEHPDLVISDVMMPKVSGFEMLDILRNTEGLQDVKVIMLTALGQSDDQQRADKLGADSYLVKSQVTLEDIVKVAARLLDETPAEAIVETPVETPAPIAMATPPALPTPVTAAVEEPVISAPIVDAPVLQPVAPTLQPITVVPSTAPAEPASQVSEPPVASAPVDPAPVVTTPLFPEPVVVAEPPVASAPVDPAPVVTTPLFPEPVVVAEPPVSPVVEPSPAPTAIEPVEPPQTEAEAFFESIGATGDMPATPVAEEQAALVAQIEDFANAEAVPANEVQPQEEDAEEQFVTTEAPDLTVSSAPVQAGPQQAGNDNVLANALESLGGSPEVPDQAPEITMSTATPPPTPSVQKGGERVITPLGPQESKPDLNVLLMKEMEAERVTAAQFPGAPIIVPDVRLAAQSAPASVTPVQVVPTPVATDPNSISL